MWAKSFTLRAVFAIGFLVLFYVVGIGVGVGIMVAPTWLMLEAGRIAPKLALLTIVLGGSVLWALVPRRTPWVDPGPRVTESDEPKLFAFIRDIATKMNTPMPSEVYLIPDVNAFVTHRGGFLGLGGSKVMGVGLTLMAVHNVSELRAVIAHEFGHFVGDETRLTGVIYATRAAMIRTLDSHAIGSWVFTWMFKLYMRITMAMSRQQELLADAWSVKLAGREANATSLRTSNIHGAGFRVFMQQEVSPLQSMGVVPDNLFDGYKRYTQSSAWTRMQPELQRSVESAHADPYDSHPSFADRMAWNEKQPDPGIPLDETPSVSLLGDVEAVEKKFSALLLPRESAKVVSWTDIGPTWGTMQRKMAVRLQGRAKDFNLGRMRQALTDSDLQRTLAEAVDPLLIGADVSGIENERARVARAYLGAWMGAVLAERGYAWKTIPGETLQLTREGVSLSPEEAMGKVFDEKKPDLEPFESIVRAAELGDEVTFALTDAERAEQAKPVAEITVEPVKDVWEVKGRLDRMRMPRCCAVCAGPAEVTMQQVMQVKQRFGDDRQVMIVMDLCILHKGDGAKAFVVKAFDEGLEEVTLHVPNEEVAKLIRACNA